MTTRISFAENTQASVSCSYLPAAILTTVFCLTRFFKCINIKFNQSKLMYVMVFSASKSYATLALFAFFLTTNRLSANNFRHLKMKNETYSDKYTPYSWDIWIMNLTLWTFRSCFMPMKRSCKQSFHLSYTKEHFQTINQP